jgi:hypothetical protein
VVVVATVAIGGFLINLAIPPAGLKNKSKDDGNSYGFDGAKNTAKEGTPLPVVYGQFTVAGNFVDLYTENVGDDQFMYGRVVLSDGEIDSVIGEPLLNEQKITNFKDVQWGYTTGADTDPLNYRFSQAKQQFFRQDLLTTSYIQYDTTGPVDAFEIDFLFPQGLADINTKTGAKTSRSVTVEIQYAPFGTSSWSNVGTTADITNGYTSFSGTSPSATNFRISMIGNAIVDSFSGEATYTLEYKHPADPTWTTYQTYTDTTTSSAGLRGWTSGDGYNVFIPDFNDTMTYSSYFPERFAELTLPLGQYQFRVTGSGTLLSTGTLTRNITPGSGGVSATTQITYSDNRTKALRRTYKSPTLPRARYSIRFRRTVASDPSHPDWIDELNCTGVTEVQHSNVYLNNISTGWFTAKMTDQLSGIPNILWTVKGCKVDIYDNNGTVTANQWSDNPADIVLDMLISAKRGPLRDKINIDFPAFVQWRTYCTAEGLKFNGVFDSMTTLWDALVDVFKVGRAFPVRAGTKLSVGVDKPANPVMLFGPGNIYKDSFQIQYLGLQDRANEFEVSYYDKDDLNKKKTIRIADPDAAQAGQIPKTVQYELFGVDNFTQAQKEVWYQLYNNRLARRVVTFDAPIESIGLSLGDVALIQHDMMDWGTSGRLAAGISTTQVTLDQKVDIEPGKTYSLLINHSRVSKATCSLSFVAGTTYNLISLSSTSSPVSAMKRFQTNTGAEAEVLDFVYTGGSNATVTLSQTVTGTTGTLWDVDVIEEKTVSTGASITANLTVSSAFSIVPDKYSNFMFGEVTSVKRPYRLRSISGDGYERRTLTFAEYNEFVYSAPEHTIPAPTAKPSVYPKHVTNLTLTTDPLRAGTSVPAYLSWSSNSILNYAGADIYISKEHSDFVFLATVSNTNNYSFDVNDGSLVTLKVIAYNTYGHRANFNTAPIVQQKIITIPHELVPPTALAWTLSKIDRFAQGLVSWTLADATLGKVSNITRVQVKYAGTTTWLDKGVTDQTKLQLTSVPAGTHDLRIRSENGTINVSDWVTTTFTVSVPTLIAPTIASDGTAIDHVINTDGSADISFEWSWAGTEADIDGFEIIEHSASTNTDYVLGTTPGAEGADRLPANKRAAIRRGVSADQYYTFYIRAYKQVDSSFAASGFLYSTAVKSTASGEHPYQPSSTVAFTGDIVGTINVTDINQWSAITGAGRPSDYANVGAVGDANRVIFSKFEQETLGWVTYDVGTSTITSTFTVHDTYDRIAITGNAVAGQNVGITNDLTNRPYRIPVTPGEKIFVGAILEVVGGGGWQFVATFRDDTNAVVSSGTVIVDSGASTLNKVRKGGFIDVPANSVHMGLEFYLTPSFTGTYTISLGSPLVCGAAPNQTTFPEFHAGSTGEPGAQINRWVDGPPQSTTFKYDYLGIAQSGEFPRDLTFKLMTSAGQITSGVTWTYQVISGTVNTFNNASGVQSMSGSGTGTLTISSLGNSGNSVIVKATFQGKDYTTTISLNQQFADAPFVSTIYGTQSGFTGPSSTTFVDTTGAMTAALPTGKTAVDINVGLSALPVSGSSGSWTVECKVMRDISGTPTQVGSTHTADSAWFAGDFSGVDAAFGFTIHDDNGGSGLTAGTTYTWRVYMRVSLGGTRSHSVSGFVTVTV